MREQIFADTPLEMITDKDINSWLLGFKERKVQIDGKTHIVRYRNTYANTVFSIFNIMLSEAVRQGFISANPCQKVRRLKNDRKKMTILTDEEVKKLWALTLNSWWHFLNTELLKQGLSVSQVQSVTGHKSIGMTERYNHFEASRITDVMKAQTTIAGTKKIKDNQEGLKLVEMLNIKSA